jgi:hypothetical protein
MDSVDVGQLVGVAGLIHLLFPVEIKANRSFTNSMSGSTVPDVKVGLIFFFGVTAIFLRVNILSCLTLRIFWIVDKKMMCHRYEFYLVTDSRGIEELCEGPDCVIEKNTGCFT